MVSKPARIRTGQIWTADRLPGYRRVMAVNGRTVHYLTQTDRLGACDLRQFRRWIYRWGATRTQLYRRRGFELLHG